MPDAMASCKCDIAVRVLYELCAKLEPKECPSIGI